MKADKNGMTVASQALKQKVVELLAKGAHSGYTEDPEGRKAEHFAFYNEEYDVVNLILQSKDSRDQLDYDKHMCTILSVAFQREKEVWKPWLEKTLVGYFHQFLLRNRFIRLFPAQPIGNTNSSNKKKGLINRQKYALS